MDQAAIVNWHDRFDLSVEILQPPEGAIGGVLGATYNQPEVRLLILMLKYIFTCL